MPRRSKYVITSRCGTPYNKNGRLNDFVDLRRRANLPDSLTFSSLRDGAYTAAAHGTTDERHARVLAGHAAAGLQDRYVLRSPQITAEACEVVRRNFMI